MKSINREEKYKLINSTLNNYFLGIDKTFLDKYIESIFGLAIQTRRIIAENDSVYQENLDVYRLLNTGYDELSEYLSYPDTIQIVREYIAEKLPQYKGIFEECLNNGITNLIIDPNDEFAEDKVIHQGIDREKHYYINTVLKHNYFDPPNLLHEFMHYLNCSPNGYNIKNPRRLLTETISIFFENDIIKYMAEKGYNPTDLAKVAHNRIMCCYNLCGETILDMVMLYHFKWLGDLSDKSKEEADKLKLRIRHFTEEDYLEDIDQYYEISKKRKEPPHILVGYLIGTVIAFGSLEKDAPDMTNKFTKLNESVEFQSMEESLSILGIDLQNKESIIELLAKFEGAVIKIDKVLQAEETENHKKNKLV